MSCFHYHDWHRSPTTSPSTHGSPVDLSMTVQIYHHVHKNLTGLSYLSPLELYADDNGRRPLGNLQKQAVKKRKNRAWDALFFGLYILFLRPLPIVG